MILEWWHIPLMLAEACGSLSSSPTRAIQRNPISKYLHKQINKNCDWVISKHTETRATKKVSKKISPSYPISGLLSLVTDSEYWGLSFGTLVILFFCRGC